MTFVLAITTFNRLKYLKKCIDSWSNSKSNEVIWTVIIADDGSTDGTLEYLEVLKIEDVKIHILKNNRIGVHQQMNTLLDFLEGIDYDFCFKVDDDIAFLKSGWDELYYQVAMETGNHHLVFCDENWCSEQFLATPVVSNQLRGSVPVLHAHGFFYTLTPQVLEKVGFMDVDSFGFRGMGHVDFTMRCARAGFSNEDTPWDVLNSNTYISATKQEYKSVLPATPVHVYDACNRIRKENEILQTDRIFIPSQPIDTNLYAKFKAELITALSDKVINFELEKKEVVDWYENEIEKINDWHENQYNYLPKWFLFIGKGFKIFK